MSVKLWSQRVTDTSRAMRLEPGVFKLPPKRLAASLKRSVMQSRNTKGGQKGKFRSAMSMLSFYANRSRPQPQRRRLAEAPGREGRATGLVRTNQTRGWAPTILSLLPNRAWQPFA